MNKSLLFLLLALGIASNVQADSVSGEGMGGPSQEEYEAALVIVQRYMLEQEKKSAARADEEAPDVFSDRDEERVGVIANAVTNPGFSVTGSGKVEAASITAITADGIDGALRVGNPDTINQAQSGRLVFHEKLDTSSNYRDDLCGFQFVHNGVDNTLSLQGKCDPVLGPPTKSRSLVVYNRFPGTPIMFGRSIGIGGHLFDGGGSGGTTGGGFLMMSFHANGTLSCENVCGNHAMTCDHSLQYGAGSPTSVHNQPCSSVPTGDFTWAMCACGNGS
jgi:hypothetical protein